MWAHVFGPAAVEGGHYVKDWKIVFTERDRKTYEGLAEGWLIRLGYGENLDG